MNSDLSNSWLDGDREFTAAQTRPTLLPEMANPGQRPWSPARHHNRVAAIMLHTSRYSCYPVSRMAADSGVAKSTISHLIHGRTSPLYNTAARLVKCLEDESHRFLDCREVFSESGSYRTKHICKLVDCPGCTPEIVFDQDNHRKPAFQSVRPGEWTGDTCEFDDLGEQERSL